MVGPASRRSVLFRSGGTPVPPQQAQSELKNPFSPKIVDQTSLLPVINTVRSGQICHGGPHMATSRLSDVVQHLRKVILLRDGAGLTDGQLLESYIVNREDVAFAALVRRHAPMVWGCAGAFCTITRTRKMLSRRSSTCWSAKRLRLCRVIWRRTGFTVSLTRRP